MASFEDLGMWKESRIFVKSIYTAMQGCKDYAFRDQLQRAAVSIMNNIAEGYERRTDSQLDYFLKIAKGSCGEVRSMIYIAYDLGYIDGPTFPSLLDQSKKIGAMITNFQKAIKKT